MNTVTLVQSMLARDYSYDVKIVEHHEKVGMPPRLSLMVYGEHNGLAVLTLERSEAWGISDVKTNNPYRNVNWPLASKTTPDESGAVDLVKAIMESISTYDQKRAK
uniref:DUF5655 domain-containing protein n=1 Tax=Pseudomonas phage HRDY3 TaxID=3236930 RepID=A0AB39CEE1_9VIRU